jgi:hypothetical protein
MEGDADREFPNHPAGLENSKVRRWPNGVADCEKCNLQRKDYLAILTASAWKQRGNSCHRRTFPAW